MPKPSSQDDQDLIRSIAELLNEQDLAEIEIEREDLRVRVTRSYASSAPVQQYAVPAYAHPAAPVPPVTPQAPAGAAANISSTTDDLATNPGTLTSPMVGTAYLQAEPGSPSFVKVGDQVAEGQTILIIEAMKTMNHIPAPKAGVVTHILFENGQPVEFGEPLVVIE